MSVSIESDLRAKCSALELALQALQDEHEALQRECDAETERRLELSLELQHSVRV